MRQLKVTIAALAATAALVGGGAAIASAASASTSTIPTDTSTTPAATTPATTTPAMPPAAHKGHCPNM